MNFLQKAGLDSQIKHKEVTQWTQDSYTMLVDILTLNMQNLFVCNN